MDVDRGADKRDAPLPPITVAEHDEALSQAMSARL
jgi:hypothetical protein